MASSRWQSFVEKVTARTDPGRDRSVDALRALAIVGVFLGHWLVGALVLRPDGGLKVTSPLRELEVLAPASWVLQMLGLFFLVGGYASTLSLERARGRGETDRTWIGRRFVRLGRPVIATVAVSAVVLAVLLAVDTPALTVRSWVVLMTQPLWFIGAYGVVTAMTPLVMRLDRRFGPSAAIPMVAIVAIVDILRYGPWHDAVPEWIGMLNVFPAWLFTYQLGVAWARGKLSRRTAWSMLIGGTVLFVALIVHFGYPPSMVGVPGAARGNSSPPSLLVPALAAVQSGLALLLAERLNRALRNPRLWAVVALLNMCAMAIFCWHQTALVAVSQLVAWVGGAHGLTDSPTDASWLVARILWLPVIALALAGFVAFAQRFERPWRVSRGARIAAGVLSVGFGAYALLVY